MKFQIIPLVLVFFFLAGCTLEQKPNCGDGVCDSAKNETCCLDCPCPSGFTCNGETRQCEKKVVCGDNVCDGSEKETCCSDCGCEYEFVCYKDTNTCINSGEEILARALKADEKRNLSRWGSLTTGEIKTKTVYDEITNERTVYMIYDSVMDVEKNMSHYYGKIGNTTLEIYVDGIVKYIKYGDQPMAIEYNISGKWVKDSTPKDYWEGLSLGSNITKKLLEKAETTISDIKKSNGKECYVIRIKSLQDDEETLDLWRTYLSQVANITNVKKVQVEDWAECISKDDYEDLESNLTLVISLGLNVSGRDVPTDLTMKLYSVNDFNAEEIVIPYEVTKAEQIPLSFKINDEYCQRIDPTNPDVRFAATQAIGKGHEGAYNANQLLDMWDYVKKNIQYVSDPTEGDLARYPAPPETTLNLKAGDCDDQATLLASMIESVGGYTVVVYNAACEHAYVMAYLGNQTSANTVSTVLDQRNEYDSSDTLFLSYDSAYGKLYFLILDPAGSDKPGRLHSDCVKKTSKGWEIVGDDKEVVAVASCKQ